MMDPIHENGKIEVDTERQQTEPLYIALGKNYKENEKNLIWALTAFKGNKIIIIHIHSPAEIIPGPLGGKMHHSKSRPEDMTSYRELEKQEIVTSIDKYLNVCSIAQAESDKLIVEGVNIETGIVDLVIQKNIHRLVMGAATDRNYSRRMKLPTSRKALYVSTYAQESCEIWFVCRGHLVYTREAVTTGHGHWPASPLPSPPSRSRFKSANGSMWSRMISWQRSLSPPSPSPVSSDPASIQLEVAGNDSQTSMYPCDHGNEISEALSTSKGVEEDLGVKHPEGKPNDVLMLSPDYPEEHRSEIKDLRDKLQTMIAEAYKFKNEAYQESVRRQQAERHALDTTRKANSLMKEQRYRKEMQELLLKEKSELEKLLKDQEDIIAESLTERSKLEAYVAELVPSKAALEDQVKELTREKALLEKRVVDTEHILHETLEELRKLQLSHLSADTTRSGGPNFSEFHFSELAEATNNFDPTLKLGEGGFGSVFRGRLRFLTVAVKRLNPGSTQGVAEFQQEVDVLTKLRHPNLVTLIGACTEHHCLIYEFLPNGSLEDRLFCKYGTNPLDWRSRSRIAAEICCALLFLHSEKPSMVVHGDLKPSNILLDANLNVKISDFGICRFLPNRNSNDASSTVCKHTDPKGTMAYIDPEFLSTGELTVKSDVYAFGIIILQLLTAKPAVGLIKEVQTAASTRSLQAIMDPAARNWPSSEVHQLVNLGLQCCQLSRKSRPDLEKDVWRVLRRYV